MFGSILVPVGDCSQMEEYVTPHKKKQDMIKWSTTNSRSLYVVPARNWTQIEPLAFEWTTRPSVQSSKHGTTMGKWDAGFFLKLATLELLGYQLSIKLLLG